MRRGSFIINNVSSNEIKSLIQERPAIPTPKRKVTLRDVPGRSGAVPFDEEAYENVDISLSLFTKGRSEAEVRYLKEKIAHILSVGSYIDFIPYFDSERVYKVQPLELEFHGDGRYPLILTYSLNLNVKPFKFLRNKNKIQGVTNDIAIYNPSPYESKPVITVYGDGDFRLIINGKEFPFRYIDDYIIIDSEFQNAYKGNMENRNDRMYSIDFPTLQSGENIISWAGDVKKIEIEPRWCWLI